MIEKLGGRKFLISLLVLICSFILVLTNKLDVSEFVKQSEIVIGIYGVSNVASKFTK